jgi:hypothetical protein
MNDIQSLIDIESFEGLTLGKVGCKRVWKGKTGLNLLHHNCLDEHQ